MGPIEVYIELVMVCVGFVLAMVKIFFVFYLQVVGFILYIVKG